jgi:hypothetical protein
MQKLKQLEISINPRYGTWDAMKLEILLKLTPAGDAVTTDSVK